MSEDIHGPGITVTGGSKVGNISRTGRGVTTPNPPPVNPYGPGAGINVTGGSSTGNIAYGNGAVAGPSVRGDEAAPPAPGGTTSGGTGWPTGGGKTGSRWPDAATAGGGQGAAEFEDLATVRRFAEQIASLGDGSDFTQIIQACADLKDMIRDFGGDMNKSVEAFVAAAAAVAQDGQALVAQSVQVAGLAQDMSGN
jgi:hypothetical protein